MKASSGSKPSKETAARRPSSPTPPVQVSGRWLLKAIGFSLLGAAACAYLSLCLLFYQGQWQLVFHPSRSITSTPATVGLAFDDLRFDATESGALQLDGWWIPAEPASRYATATLLYFHDGQGSLSDCVGQLKTLHALGINILAFDYRGFGRSVATHPTESRVYEDADGAWTYLTDTRHLDPRSIVFFGDGLGGTVAAEAASRHPSAAGLIIQNPAPSGLSLIEADPRTHLLPRRMLVQDRMELEPKLRQIKTPKAVISLGQTDPESRLRAKNAYSAAAEPKQYFEVPGAGGTQYLESLRRFLGEQLPKH